MSSKLCLSDLKSVLAVYKPTAGNFSVMMFFNFARALKELGTHSAFLCLLNVCWIDSCQHQKSWHWLRSCTNQHLFGPWGVYLREHGRATLFWKRLFFGRNSFFVWRLLCLDQSPGWANISVWRRKWWRPFNEMQRFSPRHPLSLLV